MIITQATSASIQKSYSSSDIEKKIQQAWDSVGFKHPVIIDKKQKWEICFCNAEKRDEAIAATLEVIKELGWVATSTQKKRKHGIFFKVVFIPNEQINLPNSFFCYYA
jgi:hypothetical protein